MADKPLQVRREAPKYKTMDFNYLKAMGIDLVQKLSGKIWTDYNPHDPGVTILEQLCYGIADLGFRTDFKLQDLLNARSRKGRKELNNTFFDASEILPASPVTLEDYRCLIIDRIPQVKNAWIEPIQDNLQGIQGLYRVLLQIDEEARQGNRIDALKDEVRALFAEYRNICEDIEEIQVLDVEEIVIYADIEISSDVVGEEILANIRFKLEEYLNPTIRFHTLEELLEEGYAVDEIFDGPPPVHGFIKKEDLKPIRQEIYISKLIELVSSVEGVRRIVYFKVEKSGILVEGDVLLLEPNSYPVLAIDPVEENYKNTKYPIQFYRGALNYDIDLNTANQLLYSLYAQYSKSYKMELLYNERDYPSVFKPEDISQYYSVQNTFPLTYGLSRYGLPSNISPTRERLAMIKQLRGYLLFFEQMMANYLAQLANVGQFFSINPEVNQTYYSQAPEDVPELQLLVKGYNVEAFTKKLEEMMQEFDPFTERRNRVLDHLLARFGEHFATDFIIRMNTANDPELDPDREIIRTKLNFLHHYVEVSRNRGVGYNYLTFDPAAWNVSGLQKRLSLFTQIPAHGMRSICRVIGEGQEADEALSLPEIKPFTEVVIMIQPEFVAELDWLALQAEQVKLQDNAAKDEQLDGLDELLGEVEDKGKITGASHIVQVKAPNDQDKGMDYTGGFFYFPAADADTLLQELLADGIYTYNYVMLPVEGRDTVAIYYKSPNRGNMIVKVREEKGFYEARTAIEALVRYLRQINRLTEGMYLVEHVLLRPQSKDRHGFRFVNDQEQVLLTSYELGEAQEQRFLSDELPSAGVNKANYVVQATEDARWEVILKNDYGKFIARMPQLYPSLPQAQAKVDDLIDYISSFREGNISLFNNVVFFVEQSKIAPVNDSFFSLSSSIVLPAWPLRFKNADFRQLFRNLVMMNAPAHLEINFIWLDLAEMREFENLFFAWQEARAAINPAQPDLDNKAFNLLEWFSRQQEKKA